MCCANWVDGSTDRTQRSQVYLKHLPTKQLLPPWPSKKRPDKVEWYKSVQVHLFNRQKDLPIDLSYVDKAIRETLAFLNISCDEIGVYFVTKKKIGSLHAEFFDDPTPTDCITFPIDASYLGDLFICPAVAIDYVKEHGGTPWEETLLYLIHGLLHLAGHDDMSPAPRKIMRKMEKHCMRHLKTKGISLDPASI